MTQPQPRIFWLFTFSIFFAFSLLFSCKKQEIAESKVVFDKPINNAEFSPGSKVPLSAKVTDPEGMIMLYTFVLGPDGDTLQFEQMDDDIQFEQRSKDVVGVFNHRNYYISRGIFSWYIVVANRFETFTFSRSFKIGNPDDNQNINFAIAGLSGYDQSNSGEYFSRVSLYDKNFQKLLEYTVPGRMSELHGFHGKLFYHEPHRAAYVANGFSGNDQKQLYSLNSNQNQYRTYFLLDDIFTSLETGPPQLKSFNTTGTAVANITNREHFSTALFQQGENVYSCESNQSSFNYKLITYNSRTGAYISSLTIPYEIECMFSFGDPNRIYFITPNPNTSSSSAFWYFNPQLNSVNQLTNISNCPRLAVKGLNGINYSSDKVMIITNQGAYAFSKGEQVTYLNLGTSVNFSGVKSYEYSSKENLILFQENYKGTLYSLTEGRDLASSSGNDFTSLTLMEKD